ncbi:MAG TPA: hypothetical protein PLQ36_02930, partial [Candidatus Gracilibacteria bacterium]|nr:hypothetical protein [Candidatus Gracilibacteria bacterium]
CLELLKLSRYLVSLDTNKYFSIWQTLSAKLSSPLYLHFFPTLFAAANLFAFQANWKIDSKLPPIENSLTELKTFDWASSKADLLAKLKPDSILILPQRFLRSIQKSLPNFKVHYAASLVLQAEYFPNFLREPQTEKEFFYAWQWYKMDCPEQFNLAELIIKREDWSWWKSLIPANQARTNLELKGPALIAWETLGEEDWDLANTNQVVWWPVSPLWMEKSEEFQISLTEFIQKYHPEYQEDIEKLIARILVDQDVGEYGFQKDLWPEDLKIGIFQEFKNTISSIWQKSPSTLAEKEFQSKLDLLLNSDQGGRKLRINANLELFLQYRPLDLALAHKIKDQHRILSFYHPENVHIWWEDFLGLREDYPLFVPELQWQFPPDNFPNYKNADYKLAIKTEIMRQWRAQESSLVVVFSNKKHLQEFSDAILPEFIENGDLLFTSDQNRVKTLYQMKHTEQRFLFLVTVENLPFFWGEDLQIESLILTRLPFAYPDDLIEKYRQQKCRSAFSEHSLPQSVYTVYQAISAFQAREIICLDTAIRQNWAKPYYQLTK